MGICVNYTQLAEIVGLKVKFAIFLWMMRVNGLRSLTTKQCRNKLSEIARISDRILPITTKTSAWYIYTYLHSSFCALNNADIGQWIHSNNPTADF